VASTILRDTIRYSGKVWNSTAVRAVGRNLRVLAFSAPLLCLSGDHQATKVPDSQNIRSLVSELCSSPRRVFTEGNQTAEIFIESKFREYLGDRAMISRVKIETEPTEYLHPTDTAELHNIIARLPGKDSSHTLILAAHLDSRGEGLHEEVAPGANDNASGVAALLEVARRVGAHELPFDIEFIAFNGEEYATIMSSETYAAYLPDRNAILGAIHMDMLGGNQVANRLVIGTGEIHRNFADLFRQANDPSTGLDVAVKLAGCNGDDCSFRKRGIPSVKLSETAGTIVPAPLYPGYFYYHTSADTPEKLNYTAIAGAVELCVTFIKNLSEHDHWKQLVRTNNVTSDEFEKLYNDAFDPEDDYASPTPLPIDAAGYVHCQTGLVKATGTTEGRQINYPGVSYTIKGGETCWTQARNDFLQAISSRLSYMSKSSAINIELNYYPKGKVPVSGTAVPAVMTFPSPSPKKPRRISISYNSFEDYPQLVPFFASSIFHESFHVVDKEDLRWSALYDRGTMLGTWNIFNDYVLINYYPVVGHSWDFDSEGLASAGLAYIMFPQTFREIITTLQSNELPSEPFSNENLNRTLSLALQQTPDRAALQQNIEDIYQYIRTEYFSGHEFDEDFNY